MYRRVTQKGAQPIFFFQSPCAWVSLCVCELANSGACVCAGLCVCAHTSVRAGTRARMHVCAGVACMCVFLSLDVVLRAPSRLHCLHGVLLCCVDFGVARSGTLCELLHCNACWSPVFSRLVCVCVCLPLHLTRYLCTQAACCFFLFCCVQHLYLCVSVCVCVSVFRNCVFVCHVLWDFGSFTTVCV